MTNKKNKDSNNKGKPSEEINVGGASIRSRSKKNDSANRPDKGPSNDEAPVAEAEASI